MDLLKGKTTIRTAFTQWHISKAIMNISFIYHSFPLNFRCITVLTPQNKTKHQKTKNNNNKKATSLLVSFSFKKVTLSVLASKLSFMPGKTSWVLKMCHALFMLLKTKLSNKNTDPSCNLTMKLQQNPLVEFTVVQDHGQLYRYWQQKGKTWISF